MSYIGGGPYDAETCPLCGSIQWNGRCETRIATSTGIRVRMTKRQGIQMDDY